MSNKIIYYNGRQLKRIWERSGGFYKVTIITLKNGVRDKKLCYPPTALDDDKTYICFEDSRTVGSGVEYTTIAIMNYADEETIQ